LDQGPSSTSVPKKSLPERFDISTPRETPPRKPARSAYKSSAPVWRPSLPKSVENPRDPLEPDDDTNKSHRHPQVELGMPDKRIIRPSLERAQTRLDATSKPIVSSNGRVWKPTLRPAVALPNGTPGDLQNDYKVKRVWKPTCLDQSGRAARSEVPVSKPGNGAKKNRNGKMQMDEVYTEGDFQQEESPVCQRKQKSRRVFELRHLLVD